MEQLFKQVDQHNLSWSTGYSLFLVSAMVGHWRLPIGVECRIGNLEETDLALLDTGAEWSVIGGETAKVLGDELGSPILSFDMSTRLGRISGSVHHVNICLLAEKNGGDALSVDSSVFVSEEWEGPIVLGYRGFLERIRFALDPGVVSGKQIFYFGSAE